MARRAGRCSAGGNPILCSPGQIEQRSSEPLPRLGAYGFRGLREGRALRVRQVHEGDALFFEALSNRDLPRPGGLSLVVDGFADARLRRFSDFSGPGVEALPVGEQSARPVEMPAHGDAPLVVRDAVGDCIGERVFLRVHLA